MNFMDGGLRMEYLIMLKCGFIIGFSGNFFFIRFFENHSDPGRLSA